MNNTKSYFVRLLLNNSRALIIMSICVLLFGIFMASSAMEYTSQRHYTDAAGQFVHRSDNYPNGFYYDEVTGGIRPCTTTTRVVKYRDTLLGYPMAILMITSVFVPVWMLAYTKKRKNLDCFYSLPISRRAFAMTHYLVGLIMAFVPFILSYIQVLLSYLFVDSNMFTKLPVSLIFTHFSICVLMGLVLYSISAFVFNEANSVFDGCIFIITYLVFGYFLLDVFNNMLLKDNLLNYAEYAMPHLFFGEVLNEFEESITFFGLLKCTVFSDEGVIGWMIFYVFVAIASFIGFYYYSGIKKAERSESISDTPFGYKTLIPLLAIPNAINATGLMEEEYSYYASPAQAMSIVVAALVAYTVYRRGVKYKIGDYIVLGICLFFVVVAVISGIQP